MSMSGRLSARVEYQDANYLVGAYGVNGSRDDSTGAPAPASRGRAGRAEGTIASLSERERSIVADVARVRLLSGQQLRRLHFEDSASGKRQARRVLASLVDKRVLARQGRSVGGVKGGSESFVFGLDIIGQRLIDPLSQGARPWQLGDGFVRHALMVSECYVRLVETERTGLLELLGFDGEPACWREFVGRNGSLETLKPDAFGRVGLGEYEDHWMVECDRGTEDLVRIRRKLGTYLRYWQTGKEEPFPRVLWVTTRAERAKALRGVIAGLPTGQRQPFAVCEANGFVGRIVAGAGDPTDSEQEPTKEGGEL